MTILQTLKVTLELSGTLLSACGAPKEISIDLFKIVTIKMDGNGDSQIAGNTS